MAEKVENVAPSEQRGETGETTGCSSEFFCESVGALVQRRKAYLEAQFARFAGIPRSDRDESLPEGGVKSSETAPSEFAQELRRMSEEFVLSLPPSFRLAAYETLERSRNEQGESLPPPEFFGLAPRKIPAIV